MNEATRRFLQNPPLGSKTRAAMEFGIDLTMTVRNMSATPAERLDRIHRDQIDRKLIRHVQLIASKLVPMRELRLIDQSAEDGD